MTRIRQRAGLLAIALVLVFGLGRLRLDTEVLGLLPDSVPAVRGLQLYQRHFAPSRELIITLTAADAESAENAARQIAQALESHTNEIASVHWQPPWRQHPEEIAELLAYLWRNQPPETFARLADGLTPERLETVAKAARDEMATTMSPLEIARLGYDPFGLTRLPQATDAERFFQSSQDGFTSADGRFRAVFVEARRELVGYRACNRWVNSIHQVVEGVQRRGDWPSGVRVGYTGSPAFVAEISSSMAEDMKWTVLGTFGLIAALFWWAHRSWRPLLWLMAMLLLVLLGSLAIGGLLLGALNAVSLGFGAILAGLAVDYGLVVHEEYVANPHQDRHELRQRLASALTWSAVTTAAAFFALYFAGLPGLSQLGTLVGFGMLLTPWVMVFVFLPIIARLPPRQRAADPASEGTHSWLSRSDVSRRSPVVGTALIVAVALGVVARTGIRTDHDNRAIEPGNVPAQAALRALNEGLNRRGDPLLLVVSGADEGEVAKRLDETSRHLANLKSQGIRFDAILPEALWPHPERQRANRAGAAALAGRAPAFRAAGIAAGFTDEALGLTERMLLAWARTSAGSTGLWPTNESCRWLLKRGAAWTGTNWLAAGAVFPNAESPADLAARVDPARPGIWVTGWGMLGGSLTEHVERRMIWLVPAIALGIGVCLWLAFRRWREVLIGLGALGLTLLGLQAVMGLTGLAWNLMNLAALPLLLGSGVDYGIHMQLALRHHRGDLRAVRRVTGRAVFLAAATTVAGFGTNAVSGHPGLASLGMVCAIGIALAYAVAVIIVPAWWLFLEPRGGSPLGHEPGLAQPSTTYGPGAWRLGIVAVRLLPLPVCRGMAVLGASVYRWLRPARFRVIEENLAPVLGKDRRVLRTAARRLLVNFAVKIADLLRHESGSPGHIEASRWSGYERFLEALHRGRGVLLVTPHLGNWEFGGCLLARQGVKLLVLTQPEPGRGFTELRRQARARWGIETLVVGQDAFAFVEIIRRLQDGATVALLMDRPPLRSSVEVEFLGRPFRASIAPAELARASGCAVVPVYVVAEGNGYSAQVLPEVPYDRRGLGSREMRRQFAGEILRVFEPVIRQHADQWYHFVPLWRPEPPPP